jgi:hypothetical protein
MRVWCEPICVSLRFFHCIYIVQATGIYFTVLFSELGRRNELAASKSYVFSHLLFKLKAWTKLSCWRNIPSNTILRHYCNERRCAKDAKIVFMVFKMTRFSWVWRNLLFDVTTPENDSEFNSHSGSGSRDDAQPLYYDEPHAKLMSRSLHLMASPGFWFCVTDFHVQFQRFLPKGGREPRAPDDAHDIVNERS